MAFIEGYQSYSCVAKQWFRTLLVLPNGSDLFFQNKGYDLHVSEE